MRQIISLEIFTYWNELRGSAAAPLRADVTPASIRHILPHLFILQAGQDKTPRFRLAGTAICTAFGRELREEGFASFWAKEQSADPVKISESVMEHALPTLINATGHGIGGRRMAFEMVLLPLRSAPDICDRILGCLAPASTTPWLSTEPLGYLSLDGSRALVRRPTDTDAPQSRGNGLRRRSASMPRMHRSDA